MTQDRKPVLILTTSLIFLPCLLVSPQANGFPDRDDGFVRLFNAQNLDGWDPHVPDKSDWVLHDASAWEVVDGLLVGRPGGQWLMSKGAYRDFELRLEFKLPKDEGSSVAIRSPIDGPQTAITIQFHDDANFQGFKTNATGAIAGVSEPITQGAIKPVGQWNHMRIVAQGARIVVELNGVRVQDADLYAPALRAKAQADYPGLLRHEGSIGLAAHQREGRMCFRNVKIKVLDAPAKN